MEDQSWLKRICLPTAIYDSNWHCSPTSNSRRGIYDYFREIQFEHEPSKLDIELICQILSEDPKCPGWTGINYSRINSAHSATQVIYKFYTTWDASD